VLRVAKQRPSVGGSRRAQIQETNVAEIPIQEKRGGSKLPLILGGLLLLLLLGWCLTRNRDDTVQTDTAGAVTTVPADTVGGTGTAPRSDTALTPGTGTRPDTGAAAGTATGTTTGAGTATGTSTRP
jgi:hypothetical protein